MARTLCASSTNFSTSTVRNSNCLRSMATSPEQRSRPCSCSQSTHLHPACYQFLHSFLSPVLSPPVLSQGMAELKERSRAARDLRQALRAADRSDQEPNSKQ